MMRVLFIAPLPPPTNGQSLASEVFLKKLNKIKDVKVEVVNMVKKNRPKNFLDKVKRALVVVKFLLEIFQKKKDVGLIYLTISESIAGNIKDWIIYLICIRKLDKMTIHMLGGAGMKKIIENHGIFYQVNKYFISRMSGVIVEGKTQSKTFLKLTSARKIHVIPNFAEDFLFVAEEEIRTKFMNTAPLRILYLSNLIFGKGYNELADGYLKLPGLLKNQIEIIFVGGFKSQESKEEFLEKIDGQNGLVYHAAFISGEKKRALYCSSHLFCLPTYYPYEGQPISILEAYATGCAVITTKHSGVADIFVDNVNGFEVDKQSSDSITSVIEHIIINKESLLDIAILNRNTAYDRYRTSIYTTSILKAVNLV